MIVDLALDFDLVCVVMLLFVCCRIRGWEMDFDL